MNSETQKIKDKMNDFLNKYQKVGNLSMSQEGRKKTIEEIESLDTKMKTLMNDFNQRKGDAGAIVMEIYKLILRNHKNKTLSIGFLKINNQYCNISRGNA